VYRGTAQHYGKHRRTDGQTFPRFTTLRGQTVRVVTCEYKLTAVQGGITADVWRAIAVVALVNTAAVCFTLTSATCRSLGYNITGLPNVFGQTDPARANAHLATLMALESKQCSDDIKEFACAAAFPQCVDGGRLLHPCRDFCIGEYAWCSIELS